jgi:hypothetical protein
MKSASAAWVFLPALGAPLGQQRRSPAGVAVSIFDQADWVLTAAGGRSQVASLAAAAGITCE